MANIFDYLIWRGDLSFLEAPFNEIDNLILSRVSYFPFDNTIEENECITIKEAYEKFEKLDKNTYTSKRRYRFISSIGKK